MLRYIYLLCFIISLEGVFCYKYIDNQPELRREGPRVKRQATDVPRRRLRKRQDSELDDRVLTQIDVSSFIQAPDELEDYEPVKYDSKRRQQPVSRYEAADFVPLVPLTPRAPHRPRGHRRAFQGDLSSAATDPTSSYQQQLLISRHLLKNPKKKCAPMSKMFPFFSHNKADAAHKKDKEPNKKNVKKLFRLGSCPKKTEQNKDLAAAAKTLDLHEKQKSKQEPISAEPRIEKRYAEFICPKCKKKFLRQKKRRNANTFIHNSRQYFANLKHTKPNVETSTKKLNGNTNNVFDEDLEVKRKKRKIRRFGKVVRKK